MGSSFGASGGTTDVPLNAVNCGTSGDNSIVTANATNKLRLLSAAFVPSGNVTLIVNSGLAGGAVALSGNIALTSGQLTILPLNEDGWFTTAGNAALNFNLSGNVTLNGVVKVQATP